MAASPAAGLRPQFCKQGGFQTPLRSVTGTLSFEHFPDSFLRTVAYQKLESDLMPFEQATSAAARHIVSGATIAELRTAASDLRALSAKSALADLVDAKIAELLRTQELEHLNDMQKGQL